MSDASTPPPVPEAPPPDNPPASLPAPARRDGCVTALMVVGGLVLLFPGLCFLAFAGNSGVLGLIGLVLAGCALFLLIRAAIPPTPRQ
jgi:hypothetical protein